MKKVGISPAICQPSCALSLRRRRGKPSVAGLWWDRATIAPARHTSCRSLIPPNRTPQENERRRQKLLDGNDSDSSSSEVHDPFMSRQRKKELKEEKRKKEKREHKEKKRKKDHKEKKEKREKKCGRDLVECACGVSV